MTILGSCLMPTSTAWVPGTAALAGELCSAGVWERAGGGYRILDRDAVGRCQDLARQLSGEAVRVRAQDHARAQLMPQMARAMVVTPLCAACRPQATRIELVAPGTLPAQWEHWPRPVQDSFLRHRGARPVVPDPRRRSQIGRAHV